MRADALGLPLRYRFGPARDDHAAPTFIELTIAAEGRGWSRSRRCSSGRGGMPAPATSRSGWIRRTRFGGDGWELAEVPLNEEREAYRLEIYDGADAGPERRSDDAPYPTRRPTRRPISAAPATDFTIRIAQLSAAVGPGYALAGDHPCLRRRSLALPLLVAEQAQKHVTHNEALGAARRDGAALGQGPRPRQPARIAGRGRPLHRRGGRDRRLGRARRRASRCWQDGAWSFYAPREGWRAWVEDEDAFLSSTARAGSTVGAALGALQNLTLLGIGTTADATNPFSAKLNKALWTAKTAAEGGDGDLRYTMNKETAADVLSLLLQSGFSGRAEIGLIGDDDLTIKVSPDGSAWTSALIVDKDDGAALFTCGSATARLASDGWVFALPGGGISFVTVRGELSAGFVAERYQTGGGGPVNRFNKYRGTIAAPSAVASNDTLGQFTFFGHDGAALRQGGADRRQRDRDDAVRDGHAVAPRPATLARRLGRRRRRSCAPTTRPGSAPSAPIRSSTRTGISAFAPTPSPRCLRQARRPGQMIFCSDLGGGGGLLVSDGTNWRRAREEGAADGSQRRGLHADAAVERAGHVATPAR